jgi:hypothetical protein
MRSANSTTGSTSWWPIATEDGVEAMVDRLSAAGR